MPGIEPGVIIPGDTVVWFGAGGGGAGAGARPDCCASIGEVTPNETKPIVARTESGLSRDTTNSSIGAALTDSEVCPLISC